MNHLWQTIINPLGVRPTKLTPQEWIGPLFPEFNYRYAEDNHANIYVGLQVQEGENIEPILARLRENGYPAVDLTDNEMAKLHIRHMVGGRSPGSWTR